MGNKLPSNVTKRGDVYQINHNTTFMLRYEAGVCESGFIKIDGRELTLRKGFSWNGSNVAKDIDYAILASAVHDALCICHNEGLTDLITRKQIDEEYLRYLTGYGVGILTVKIRGAFLALYRNFK